MNWPEQIRLLLKELGWETGDLKLYIQALTHTSYAHEKGHSHVNNERLEFLGDAVLELIISDYLFYTYPQMAEGNMTKLRADLVCEASLARIAFSLNLGRYLRLGKGERAGGGSSRPSLLSDAVEALIGALYIDLGLEKTREYVLKLYEPILNDLSEGILSRDFKTLLQEYSQAGLAITPDYAIVAESGPDHQKEFESVVMLSEKVVGRGKGRSKKEAEQAAAKEAWNQLTP